MTFALLASLLSAAPAPAPAALPDVPAPLGRLVDVLVDDTAQPLRGEKIVSATLKGCDHKVPLHVTHFAAGAMYAMQQLTEWMAKTPGVEAELYARKGVQGEVITGLTTSLPGEVHACKPMAKNAAAAPKLCPGAAPNEAWLLNGKAPAALIRWEPSKECIPRITGVLFDAKGAARLRYDADFAGAVAATLVGDHCEIDLTFDAAKQVFHPARRGCKGP
jgi:hypothetical protein